MAKRLILEKTGTQYLVTEVPEAAGAHGAAVTSYDNWQEMEDRLLAQGAFPDAVERVKSDFDSGKASTSVEIRSASSDRQMMSNELFLAVLPLIHVTSNQYLGYGMTEQTLTLFPDRGFATQFFPDEVDSYIQVFQSKARKYLAGGHVLGYDIIKEPTPDGRIVVKVVQHVG